VSQVRIVRGEYHDKPVSGVFDLVKPYKEGKRGGFITIQNDGSPAFANGGLQCRVRVTRSADFQYLGEEPRRPVASAIAFTPADTVKVEAESKPEESDEQAMDRIATRFAILDEMTRAAINSDIRAMIVSGPPGVGKSFGVETQLEKATLFDKIAGKKIRFEIVKGALTALGLYSVLYKFSDAKNVLVFDDADGVFADELSLNLLKAALDSGKRRKIFWNSDSSMLRREGIPDSFEFNGSVIFITNLNFGTIKSKKLQDHLEALQSRCHFLDLTINSERDKLLRVMQVHRDVSNDRIGGLFADYDFPEGKDKEILDFMWENRTRLREISLRMTLKIADLMKISPTNWKMLAENTVMFNR
jgi:replicative DNA helicase